MMDAAMCNFRVEIGEVRHLMERDDSWTDALWLMSERERQWAQDDAQKTPSDDVVAFASNGQQFVVQTMIHFASDYGMIQ